MSGIPSPGLGLSLLLGVGVLALSGLAGGFLATRRRRAAEG